MDNVRLKSLPARKTHYKTPDSTTSAVLFKKGNKDVERDFNTIIKQTSFVFEIKRFASIPRPCRIPLLYDVPDEVANDAFNEVTSVLNINEYFSLFDPKLRPWLLTLRTCHTSAFSIAMKGTFKSSGLDNPNSQSELQRVLKHDKVKGKPLAKQFFETVLKAAAKNEAYKKLLRKLGLAGMEAGVIKEGETLRDHITKLLKHGDVLETDWRLLHRHTNYAHVRYIQNTIRPLAWCTSYHKLISKFAPKNIAYSIRQCEGKKGCTQCKRMLEDYDRLSEARCTVAFFFNENNVQVGKALRQRNAGWLPDAKHMIDWWVKCPPEEDWERVAEEFLEDPKSASVASASSASSASASSASGSASGSASTANALDVGFKKPELYKKQRPTKKMSAEMREKERIMRRAIQLNTYARVAGTAVGSVCALPPDVYNAPALESFPDVFLIDPPTLNVGLRAEYDDEKELYDLIRHNDTHAIQKQFPYKSFPDEQGNCKTYDVVVPAGTRDGLWKDAVPYYDGVQDSNGILVVLCAELFSIHDFITTLEDAGYRTSGPPKKLLLHYEELEPFLSKLPRHWLKACVDIGNPVLQNHVMSDSSDTFFREEGQFVHSHTEDAQQRTITVGEFCKLDMSIHSDAYVLTASKWYKEDLLTKCSIVDASPRGSPTRPDHVPCLNSKKMFKESAPFFYPGTDHISHFKKNFMKFHREVQHIETDLKMKTRDVVDLAPAIVSEVSGHGLPRKGTVYKVGRGWTEQKEQCARRLATNNVIRVVEDGEGEEEKKHPLVFGKSYRQKLENYGCCMIGRIHKDVEEGKKRQRDEEKKKAGEEEQEKRKKRKTNNFKAIMAKNKARYDVAPAPATQEATPDARPLSHKESQLSLGGSFRATI